MITSSTTIRHRIIHKISNKFRYRNVNISELSEETPPLTPNTCDNIYEAIKQLIL